MGGELEFADRWVGSAKAGESPGAAEPSRMNRRGETEVRRTGLPARGFGARSEWLSLGAWVAGRWLPKSAPFEPVTDAMLENPRPADWLNWRRTLDGWGYSPLDQITTDNVHRLPARVELGPRSGVATDETVTLSRWLGRRPAPRPEPPLVCSPVRSFPRDMRTRRAFPRVSSWESP